MSYRLLTIHVERRRIAVALFSGLRLDYAQVRELSSRDDLARRSTRSFIAWLAETFEPEFAAVESLDVPDGTRRFALHRAVTSALRYSCVAQTEVGAAEVRAALGVPGIATKSELRVAAAVLWPDIAGFNHPAVLDAAALGLHLQMTATLSDK